MLAPPWPSPPLERVLPLAARAVLAAGHRRALERAQGRVLDLSPAGFGGRPGPAVSEVVTLALAGSASGPAGSAGGGSGAPGAGVGGGAVAEALARGPFDTVISVLHLAFVDDARGRLGELRAALSPSGRLFLVEPYRRAGWRGALSDVSTPLVRASTGLRIDHPVPALVRAVGFTIVSIERKTMPTLVLVPFRFVVELTAVPSAASPAGPTGDRRP